VVAARERASDGTARAQGSRRPFTAYASSQAHSSVEKALVIAGLGADSLRPIDVDERYALRPEALERAVAADLARGLVPCFACATVGTTSSGAVDPVRAAGAVCRRYGLWLHVDAAMAGTAALCPEYRSLHDGLELADSYCFNAHKWMPVNFDCDCFYVADRAALTGALRVVPEYLRNRATESAGVIDYRDWQVPLGRRFRALKLWFVLRSFGVEGLQRRVRGHVALAREFASWVEGDDRFELAAPVSLNLVCFRHTGGDAVNQGILDRLNGSGRLYLTHTRLGGRLTLRMSIGQMGTRRRHVRRAWQLIREAAAGAG
jgi:aromatic-L-amino-acid decarboxylase